MKINLLYCVLIIAIVIILGHIFPVFPVQAATALSQGQIIVADPSAPSDKGGIYQFDSLGNQLAVYTDSNFEEPTGVTTDSDGNILVGDPQALGGGGAIFKINPASGVVSTVSSGGYFVDPRGILVEANGNILVADSDAFNYYGGVIRVNPLTGAQSIVYQSTDQNSGPFFIALEQNGDILLTDVSAFAGSGGVFRINPTTGAATTLSSGDNFGVPIGIAVAKNGDIFVAINSGKIIKVDRDTGTQTVIASSSPLGCPTGLAIDGDGNLLIGDPCNEPGAVIKLTIPGYTMSVLKNFGNSPNGVAVVPSPTPAPVCILPPNNMVSWWPGNGNANDIIGSNHGTFLNGVATVAGKVNQAFAFDGVDDKVLIGNPTNLRLQDFTIDAWIKLNSLTIDGFAERIAGYSIGGYGFFLTGPYVVNVNGASAVRQLALDKAGFDMVAAPFAINDTGWHHVAVTKSGGTVTFYLDGVLGTAQRGGSPIASYNPGFVFNTNFTLGSLDDQVQPLPGMLDEVEVFNRALTTSEIQSIFNAGSAGKCLPPPVVDTESPVLSVPSPIIVEALSATGIGVTYSATATDNVAVSSTDCSPTSGSTFPVGVSTVNCTASDTSGNTSSASFTVTVTYTPPPSVITVKIDIMPNKFPNKIQAKSHGPIKVAILSSNGFNALHQVNKSTLTFGRAGTELSLLFCGPKGKDVNHDKLLDLICKFSISTAGFKPHDSMGFLKGKTTTGVPIAGSDSVVVK